MRVLIKEGCKGFLFKKGKFIKMVGAGVYNTLGGKSYEVCEVNNSAIKVNDISDLEIFNSDSNFQKETLKVEVKSGEIVVHIVDGIFESVLTPNKYYFWNANYKHQFLHLNLNTPEIPSDFPKYLLAEQVLSPYVSKFEINSKSIGVLLYNHKFVKLLEPGIHFFTKGSNVVTVIPVESCVVSQDIVGQELLTNDKVSLRINCVVNYKVNDYVKVITEINDYKNQLYTYVQLALRDYIGEKTFDEILASKKEMSKYLLDTLKEKGKELYLSINEASVKDIILPGEIRDIMNTVLIAEKRAQANVITRREEVASTRSLLNTARLMDENATLYKLKELEYVERICEKVGNININGGSDVLSQLTGMLSSNKNNPKNN